MTTSSRQSGRSRYKWMILSRVLAASLGAYFLTSLVAAVLALALPMLFGWSRAEGVLIATLLSFAIYTALAIWTFSVARVIRVWWWLLIWTAIFSVLLKVLMSVA